MDFQVPQRHNNSSLKFGRTDKGLIGYVDSDYAADLDHLQVMCLLLAVVM